jgi:hypothetical protein
MMTPVCGPSDELVRVTSTLFLNATKAATLKVDTSAILNIHDNIKEYCHQLKSIIDLQNEIQVIHTNNTDYAQCTGILEGHLQTTNKNIRILPGLMTNALTLWPIECPHPPKYSGDRKELPNVISKVHLKLAGEKGHFSDNQYKLCDVYGYLKGNNQNQIQPYIQIDNISLEDIEALIKMLSTTFSNPDDVRTASAELDRLMQGTPNSAFIMLNLNI